MANKGGCGKRWPQIRAELEKHLGPVDDEHIAMTHAPNHATKLAQDAVDAGYRRLVSVGGAPDIAASLGAPGRGAAPTPTR